MKILIADGCCIVIEYFNFWQKEKLHFCSASPKHVFHSSSYKRFYPGSKLSLFRSCVCSDLENCFPLKTRSGYKSTFVATGSLITEGQMKLQQMLYCVVFIQSVELAITVSQYFHTIKPFALFWYFIFTFGIYIFTFKYME